MLRTLAPVSDYIDQILLDVYLQHFALKGILLFETKIAGKCVGWLTQILTPTDSNRTRPSGQNLNPLQKYSAYRGGETEEQCTQPNSYIYTS